MSESIEDVKCEFCGSCKWKINDSNRPKNYYEYICKNCGKLTRIPIQG